MRMNFYLRCCEEPDGRTDIKRGSEQILVMSEAGEGDPGAMNPLPAAKVVVLWMAAGLQEGWAPCLLLSSISCSTSSDG